MHYKQLVECLGFLIIISIRTLASIGLGFTLPSLYQYLCQCEISYSYDEQGFGFIVKLGQFALSLISLIY